MSEKISLDSSVLYKELIYCFIDWIPYIPLIFLSPISIHSSH